MEIYPSAVGETLVCTDLGLAVFFWFDPQGKQLAVAFWTPAALTMNWLCDAVREAPARWENVVPVLSTARKKDFTTI